VSWSRWSTLVAAIHVFAGFSAEKTCRGRDKRGHDKGAFGRDTGGVFDPRPRRVAIICRADRRIVTLVSGRCGINHRQSPLSAGLRGDGISTTFGCVSLPNARDRTEI